MKFKQSILISGVVLLGISPAYAAMTLTPGIYVLEELTAEPEPVTVTSVGTDEQDAANFRKSQQETFNLEVYELQPGFYRFVREEAAKTDQAVLNAEADGLSLTRIVTDSGAEGVAFRGTGSYPGATTISFGIINEFPEVPLNTDGSLNVERAAGEIGYKFFTGRNYFLVDGVVGVFENISIGDHGNNNTGVVRTQGGGRTFMKDTWIFNVYDGIFFADQSEGYFVNCIFNQSFQPWSGLSDAQADGYFTDEWNSFVEPNGLQDQPFVDGLQSLGVDITEEAYPQVAGTVLRNDAAWAYNITLFQNRGNPDLQSVYLKNCTLVKHILRDTNATWRHLTGTGLGATVLVEDCMILNLDTSPNSQIRFETVAGGDSPFVGNMYNTKFWNYAANDANVQGWDTGWYQESIDVNPGGLDIGDVSELFRLDGRKLTTFVPGSVELTMASDGGQVGYRLPATAPAGPLPVVTGSTPVKVAEWMVY